MEGLTQLVGLSTLIWYIVDKFKEAWIHLSFGHYITMFAAAALGFAVTFSYGLDFVVALGIAESVTIIGQILTGLSFMAGSSVVAEIIERVQHGGGNRDSE